MDILTIAIAVGTFLFLLVAYGVCKSMKASLTNMQARSDYAATAHARDGGVMYGGRNRLGED